METMFVFMESHSKRQQRLEQQPVLYFELHIGYWMLGVSNHSQGRLGRVLQKRRTSVAEWVVMCHIRVRPGITSGELAEILGMTRGAVSKVIGKLEAKNWVARSTKPEDGRVQLISLTQRCSQIFPQLAEVVDQNDRKFFGSLDVDERAILRRLLKKLAVFHHIRAVKVLVGEAHDIQTYLDHTVHEGKSPRVK